VRLIIQVQAVIDQLVDIDFRRPFRTPVAKRTSRTPAFATLAAMPLATRSASFAPLAAARSSTAFSAAISTARGTSPFARRPIFAICLLCRLLFSHFESSSGRSFARHLLSVFGS
jgi:hypothetical protein